MISLRVGDCKVDILPVVSGLVSEGQKVRDAYGKYEAYAVSLGIEGVEAVRRRKEIPEDLYEISELDIVYAERMSYFGEVEAPSPAFCELIDLCTTDGISVIPLDMKDEDFDTAYMNCVSAFQFTNQHRLAKKGMKVTLDIGSPEAMAKSWDAFVSQNKGLRKLDLFREKYIAKEIRSTAQYRKSLLAVIECERADGIAELLSDE
ncbi:MAG: hypothetical protein E7Z63_01280 [Thermoplasmata archaeon]|nr:hypothetical protein [Thermoplasmata archaeon]